MIVALVSLALLLSAALYLPNPTETSFAATPVYVTSIASHGAVVYGDVTNSAGHAVRGAEVTVFAKSERRHHTVYTRIASARTNAKGVYRTVVYSRASGFRIQISARIGGKRYSTESTLRLRKRHAYKISARARAHGIFSFLPVSTY